MLYQSRRVRYVSEHHRLDTSMLLSDGGMFMIDYKPIKVVEYVGVGMYCSSRNVSEVTSYLKSVSGLCHVDVGACGEVETSDGHRWSYTCPISALIQEPSDERIEWLKERVVDLVITKT